MVGMSGRSDDSLGGERKRSKVCAVKEERFCEDGGKRCAQMEWSTGLD